MTTSDVPAISLQTFCGALYCAYTSRAALAPDPAGRLAFRARVEDRDQVHWHQAEFEGVEGFEWRSERPRPEPPAANEPVELSVIELEGRPGAWRVWFNPWYLHEIEFHCRRIRLDGAEVAGEGRWLQDELPPADGAATPSARAT